MSNSSHAFEGKKKESRVAGLGIFSSSVAVLRARQNPLKRRRAVGLEKKFGVDEEAIHFWQSLATSVLLVMP
jgi:hypothetical protein